MSGRDEAFVLRGWNGGQDRPPALTYTARREEAFAPEFINANQSLDTNASSRQNLETLAKKGKSARG
jgi:hypothetical protein